MAPRNASHRGSVYTAACACYMYLQLHPYCCNIRSLTRAELLCCHGGGVLYSHNAVIILTFFRRLGALWHHEVVHGKACPLAGCML